MVFGDHGMTLDGNHGGASPEELDAALLVYSPRALPALAAARNRGKHTFGQHLRRCVTRSYNRFDIDPVVSAAHTWMRKNISLPSSTRCAAFALANPYQPAPMHRPEHDAGAACEASGCARHHWLDALLPDCTDEHPSGSDPDAALWLQIDLPPTLAMLFGVPTPYGSLGTAHLELLAPAWLAAADAPPPRPLPRPEADPLFEGCYVRPPSPGPLFELPKEDEPPPDIAQPAAGMSQRHVHSKALHGTTALCHVVT